MPKVATIRESNLRKQLAQVSSGQFKKRLDQTAQAHQAGIDELEKAMQGEDYAFETVRELVKDLANDDTLYKGLILAYTLVQERKGQIAQGRRISRKKGVLELYRAILAHDPKKMTVSAFCRKHQITRNRYYRIKNKQVSHPEDRALLDNLEQEV